MVQIEGSILKFVIAIYSMAAVLDREPEQLRPRLYFSIPAITLVHHKAS
jgi:hypothetical protein